MTFSIFATPAQRSMRAPITLSLVTLALAACGNHPPPAPTPPPAAPIAPSFGDPAPTAMASASASASTSASEAPPAPPPEPDVTVLARKQHASAALTADGSHVYWVEDVEGSVTRIPKRGGAVMMFYSATGGFASPSTIAIDDQDVYWTEHVKQDGVAGLVARIVKQDKHGGKPTPVATNVRDELRALAIDDKGVLFISGAAILRVAKSGGAATPLTQKLGDPTSVAGDGKFVYWTQTASPEKGKDGGAVIRQPQTPGAKQEVLAAGQDKPGNLLVDDDGLCWVTAAKVACMTKAKDAAPKIVGESAGGVADSAIDAKYVYWLGSADGTVMRAPRDGSSPAEKLAGGQTNPVGISVDKTNVYWSTKGTEANQFRDGTVATRPKP